MKALVVDKTSLKYSQRTAVGASEFPIVVTDVSSAVPYELFDANIALIENTEGAEILVHRGAIAVSDADRLGIVAGFLLDTSNGAISHLLLHTTETDIRSEVIVPVSEVAGCDADKVFVLGT